MNKSCPECGFPLQGNESTCPECGYPLSRDIPINNCVCPLQTFKQKDPANYIYECWIIGWKSFCNGFTFTGRASRREYWSFTMVFWLIIGFTAGIGLFIMAIPGFAVTWRRFHDIGKSGLWSFLPIFNFFWLLKASDKKENKYGKPFPAVKLL